MRRAALFCIFANPFSVWLSREQLILVSASAFSLFDVTHYVASGNTNVQSERMGGEKANNIIILKTVLTAESPESVLGTPRDLQTTL